MWKFSLVCQACFCGWVILYSCHILTSSPITELNAHDSNSLYYFLSEVIQLVQCYNTRNLVKCQKFTLVHGGPSRLKPQVDDRRSIGGRKVSAIHCPHFSNYGKVRGRDTVSTKSQSVLTPPPTILTRTVY